MAESHQYFYLESLNLTAPQRQTLVTQLLGIGRANNSSNPAHRMQSRLRNDNLAIIFEAVIEENDLTINAIKARLASIFGVAIGTISHNVANTAYGTAVVFIHSGQNRIRLGSFGHNGSAWGTTAQSREAALAYLIANAATWEQSL